MFCACRILIQLYIFLRYARSLYSWLLISLVCSIMLSQEFEVSMFSPEHESLFLFKLLSCTYNRPLQSHIDMANTLKLTHKRRMSDRGNTDTWTSKKRVSVPMRILVSLTEFRFSKERNKLLHQTSCWEEAVNSENICEDYLAICHQ